MKNKILNLDKFFKPLKGEEIEYQLFTFYGGEPHIKILDSNIKGSDISVTHRINSFNDLGFLLVAVDAIRRMGGVTDTLFIPYFPAARQDRVMTSGEALTVKVYADLINQLNFKNVIVFDPHSEVAPALINNSTTITNHIFIEKTMRIIGREVILISPDGGALKKIYKLSQFLGGIPVIECSKSRDVATGKLSGFRVYDEDLQGKDCLIVDDICDGGGTFLGLAKELQKKNSGKLHLAVSHGIFSKGLEELTSVFDKIFTTNSISEIENSQLFQIPLNTEILG